MPDRTAKTPRRSTRAARTNLTSRRDLSGSEGRHVSSAARATADLEADSATAEPEADSEHAGSDTEPDSGADSVADSGADSEADSEADSGADSEAAAFIEAQAASKGGRARRARSGNREAVLDRVEASFEASHDARVRRVRKALARLRGAVMDVGSAVAGLAAGELRAYVRRPRRQRQDA